MRTAQQWKATVARNPFPEDARSDSSHLLVMFLRHAPQAGAVKALRVAITGPELVRVDSTEAYLVYPNRIGRSRVTSTLIEKELGTSGTGRNWNTVLRLSEVVGRDEERTFERVIAQRGPRPEAEP